MLAWNKEPSGDVACKALLFPRQPGRDVEVEPLCIGGVEELQDLLLNVGDVNRALIYTSTGRLNV